MRIRPVEKAQYVVFLDRAEKFVAMASAAPTRGRYQAAVSNAVHAAIAAVDAASILRAGVRSASQRHEDAVHILGMLRLPESELEPRARQLRRLLGLKTKAEYADGLVTAREAEDSVQDAELLVAWVKRLPEGGPSRSTIRMR